MPGPAGSGIASEQPVDHLSRHVHAVVLAQAQGQIDRVQYRADLEGGYLGIEVGDLARGDGPLELRRERRAPGALLRQ